MASAHAPTESETPSAVTADARPRDGRSLLFAMLCGALLMALVIFAAWWWLALPTPAVLTLDVPAPPTIVANPPIATPLSAGDPSLAQPPRSFGVQIVGGALININSATLAELETLPGIGPARARAIVEGRPFANVDALDDVPGIGPATLEQLRSRVTTD